MALSMLQRIRGRIISKGIGKGSAVVTHQPLSFLGGVDPKRGVIKDAKHELYR